jgi:hypothetical protein
VSYQLSLMDEHGALAMSTDIPFDVRNLISGYLEQLKVEAQYFSDPVRHAGEKGRLNETHFTSILRRYLPRRFGIGSGFVVSANKNKPWSHQCDIIIYDALNNAPLYESPAFSIYPIEMVYGVIEVKTDISGQSALNDCFEKCAHLRKMAQEYIEDHEAERLLQSPDSIDIKLDHHNRWARSFKRYLRYTQDGLRSFSMHFSPRFFVFAYRGWQTASTIRQNFMAATAQYSDAHIHGVCILNEAGGFYTGTLRISGAMKKLR